VVDGCGTVNQNSQKFHGLREARAESLCVCEALGNQSMKQTRLFYRMDEQLWRTSQIMRGCFGLPRLMLTIVTMRGMSTSTTAIQTTTIRTITILFGWLGSERDTSLSSTNIFCLAFYNYSSHPFRKL